MTDNNRPTVQVRNRGVLGQDYTENLQLEGNRHNRLRSYTQVWAEVLTPKGGIEAMLLQGLLYSCSIAFAISAGSYVLVVVMVVVTTILMGGFSAVVLEPKLLAPYTLRCLMVALGFVITLL